MYDYVCIYIYIYFSAKDLLAKQCCPQLPLFMCGFYYHFNNLRFRTPQNVNDFSAAHVLSSFKWNSEM